MLVAADLDEAYAPKNTCQYYRPECNAPSCFIGSYPPVTPAGHMGPFFVNTYFLRPDRKSELVGPVPVRKISCLKN
jgi:hypothetical protein